MTKQEFIDWLKLEADSTCHMAASAAYLDAARCAAELDEPVDAAKVLDDMADRLNRNRPYDVDAFYYDVAIRRVRKEADSYRTAPSDAQKLADSLHPAQRALIEKPVKETPFVRSFRQLAATWTDPGITYSHPKSPEAEDGIHIVRSLKFGDIHIAADAIEAIDPSQPIFQNCFITGRETELTTCKPCGLQYVAATAKDHAISCPQCLAERRDSDLANVIGELRSHLRDDTGRLTEFSLRPSTAAKAKPKEPVQITCTTWTDPL